LSLGFRAHRDLHSFPTRRSSDLGTRTQYLTPLEERLRLIDALGVDRTLLIHLSDEFLHLTAEEFIRTVLAERLGTVAVVASESRSEEHTSELQSRFDLVCRLLLE